MLRIPLLISLLLSSLTLVESTSATVTYTPGAMIAMTGSNSDVRFDVASILVAEGSSESAPALVTTSKKFTGAFYASGIGWIVFASGSNQVSLDCGAQSLSALTGNCTLTGTGWSENIGDIYFSSGVTITYNPNTGLLSGSAVTFAGDIDLTGVTLPLRPVTLDQTSLVANHAATLSVTDAWMYDAGTSGWEGSVSIGLDTRLITSSDGTYTVDFSLANEHYTIKIEDTNGSETEISGFIVDPDTITTTLTTAPSYHAADFCNSAILPTSICPDGTTRSATILDKAPISGDVVADGTDAYALTFKARDQYGNRVKTGNIRITYDTTVKNIQTDITNNINYGPSNGGDAFISDMIPTGLFGTSDTTLTLTPSDIIYMIASTAPTNSTNEIKLDSISHNGGSNIVLPGWKIPLSFTPLFTVTVSTPHTPIINTPHIFETTVTTATTNIPTTLTPTIITTMQIGDGSSAEWRSLTSTPGAACSNYPFTNTTDFLCDWSGVSSIATVSGSDFAYTGTYTTWLPDAAGETTTTTGYIYYNNGSSDILYSTHSSTITAATVRTQRVRLLGQSGEGVGGGARTRVDLISDIRQQIALMSRNRTNYDDVDYIVYDGDHTITTTELDGETGKKAKRSIITLGGDITITDNITLRDHPIALIALTDIAGNGGNIKIAGTVTDISSSLIAEHAIISDTSDSQLYIYGSIISANPPREIAPTGCPYFAPSGCVRSDYDLPGSRDAYSALGPADRTAKASNGGGIHLSPLVIEGDPRLLRDPSPAMSR